MNIYNFGSEDLTRLGPHRAVQFFRTLLWNEASRVGVNRSQINFIEEIYARDGGIDALVQSAKPTSDDIIPLGLSGFQIKSTDLTPDECKKELHQGRKLDEPLRSEIQKVLESKGTYILVLFADHADPEKRKLEQAIADELTRMNFRESKIRLYLVNQMIGFTTRFPAIVAWLRQDLVCGLPYAKWAGNRDVALPKLFVVDQIRSGIIREIQEKLRGGNQDCPVFRMTGLSGLGKTRLIFETLSPEDLASRVLYCATGQSFNLLMNFLVMDANQHAIIVCDECSSEDHERLARSLSQRGPRLSLITISHDLDKHPPPTLQYRLDRLPDEKIFELLSREVKGLPRNVVDRLTRFSDGYPRLAMLLSENYLAVTSSVDDILNVNDEVLITKLIAGRLDPGSDRFSKTKTVLTGLSLFEKVGYEEPVSHEAQWVASLVDVGWSDFQEIVSQQRQRGIIQGGYYVYVTPFVLAIHLSRQWWSVYGKPLQLQELFKTMPRDMADRLFGRFPYVTSTATGREFVKELLSNGGIFGDGSFLKSPIGENLFSELSEADPESALRLLQATIGTWSKEQLLAFRIGRRGVVSSLERIAVWKEFFTDAAELLLVLGEAENEEYANNASGVFADLFSPAWGELAPTEASPQERFPTLTRAFSSESLERRKLALKGFEHALESRHFIRFGHPEYQGSKPVPKLWAPRTEVEVLQHYERTWTYLKNNLESLGDLRSQGLKVLLGGARGLAGVDSSISDMIKMTLEELSSHPWVDRKELLQTVTEITHYDGKRMTERQSREWNALRENLVGSGFSNLLRRYVGMDLLEDYFPNGAKYEPTHIEQIVRDLACQAVENPSLLESEYSWLVTTQAKRGHQFGYEIGRLDRGFTLLNRLNTEQRKAQADGSYQLLGGYLRALFEADAGKWEDTLDRLSDDDYFAAYVPELTWRSGMTDRALKRIIWLAKEGKVDASNLTLLSFGGALNRISKPVFTELAEFLLKEDSGVGAITTLDACFFNYVLKPEGKLLDKELTLAILLSEVFWSNPKNVQLDQMSDYRWKETALALMKQFPDGTIPLAKRILEFLGDEKSIAGSFGSEVKEVLTEAAKAYPTDLWKLVTEYLVPPLGTRAFYLSDWLREKRVPTRDGEGAIVYFDPEDMWKWVEGDTENRAPLLATFVPPFFFSSNQRVCLARELLVRYGGIQGVAEALSANYFTESYTGRSSIHYRNKKENLLRFRGSERNPVVLEWIDSHVLLLERRIEKSEIDEERRGF